MAQNRSRMAILGVLDPILGVLDPLRGGPGPPPGADFGPRTPFSYLTRENGFSHSEKKGT